MAQRMSDALADTLAQIVADTFSDGLLEVYAGAQGLTPDDVSGATLLCQVLLPAVAFQVASGGVVTKDGAWFGTVSASGQAAFGRFANRANDKHLIVTISVPFAGGELQLDSLALLEGGVVDVSTFSYTVPTGA